MRRAISILIEGEVDVKAVDEDGNTPLHFAASHYYDEEVANALIEKGADVNAINHDRCTSLHCAVRGDRTSIVKALTKNEANVKALDKDGSTPLHFAALRYRNEEIVQALVGKGQMLMRKIKINVLPCVMLRIKRQQKL